MEMKLLPGEKENYLLPTETDLKILEKIHNLEKIENLSEDEKFLLLLIRTQLEKDWRRALVVLLDEFMENKNLKPEERWKKIKEKADSSFWRP